MKITKIGHCAMVVEINGAKLLTDPGSFTAGQTDEVRDIDAVLITHEHQDHFHLESLNIILRNNPDAEVICNASMQKLLQVEEIPCTVIGDGEAGQVKGIVIEGFGTKHAQIYADMGQVENTGYFLANTFYFPGDNFHNPGKPVEVLALPAAGPWMKMSEAIDFAKELKPKTAFPVHDGMLMPFFRGFIVQALTLFVPGTEFVSIEDGETKEF